MALTPEEQELADQVAASGKTTNKATKTGKSGKIAKVDGMAGALAAKTGAAQNAAIATADRDSLVYAQTYLQRFDSNMGAINGKLTEAWVTVGGFEGLISGGELPPFEDQLNTLLSS